MVALPLRAWHTFFLSSLLNVARRADPAERKRPAEDPPIPQEPPSKRRNSQGSGQGTRSSRGGGRGGSRTSRHKR